MEIKPDTAKKIMYINDYVYSISDNDISDDTIIDIAVDLLDMVFLAIYDESIKADLYIEGLSDAEIKATLDANKKFADAVKNSLTGFIGDAEKTALFIKHRLNQNSRSN